MELIRVVTRPGFIQGCLVENCRSYHGQVDPALIGTVADMVDMVHVVDKAMAV